LALKTEDLLSGQVLCALVNSLNISKFSDLIGQPRANSPPIWGAALIRCLTALSYLYRSYAALYPAAFRSATCRRKWLMQSPLGILSLPLFAPVIMHSLGALIRRGSVSRSAFHPAGREEERKERGAQGMAEGHLFPPASLFNFF
jgi:hypothetical protein